VARTGGRNSWIAWPIGLLCASVVAALAWLSQPLVPVSIAWMGDMLRTATSPPVAAAPGESVASRASAPGDIDCRALYPDRLWAELTWTPTVLTDALTPSVRISCHWRTTDGGSVDSTLARVGADAAVIADASLRGQGFTCATDADAVVCSRSVGDVLEEHTFRGGLWLSSVERAWHPEAYAARVAAQVWG
jgi:hypothetical protein